MQPAEQATITKERYVVQKAEPRGYAIIDTTGRDQPYTIDGRRPLNTYELELLTPGDIKGYEAFDREVAEEWAHTWNLVETGHCGLCKRRVCDIAGYESGPNGEPPLHQHTSGHHMYRALCFSCSCSQDD